MKKILFITSLPLLLLISVIGNAQIYSSSLHPDSDWGIKAGGNFQQLSASPFVPAYNNGYVAGLFIVKHINKIAIRVEALVSNAHYTTVKPVTYGLFYEKGYDTVHKGDFNALYISIPILVQFKLTKKLWFEAGLQYNYMLSLTDNNNAYTKHYKNDNIIKKSEVCVDLGLSYQLTHHFNIDARYIYGITNVSNHTYYRAYDAWTINAAQVSLSFRF